MCSVVHPASRIIVQYSFLRSVRQPTAFKSSLKFETLIKFRNPPHYDSFLPGTTYALCGKLCLLAGRRTAAPSHHVFVAYAYNVQLDQFKPDHHHDADSPVGRAQRSSPTRPWSFTGGNSWANAIFFGILSRRIYGIFQNTIPS